MRVRLEQSGGNGSAAISGDKPEFVHLLRRKLRQAAGEEDETAIAALVDGLAARLRLVSLGDHFDFQCVRVEQRFQDFFGFLKLTLLTHNLRMEQYHITLQRRILTQESNA